MKLRECCRQSHLRQHPQKTRKYSLACDFANELGLSGNPSAEMWAKVEHLISKSISDLVSEATAEQNKRLKDIKTIIMRLTPSDQFVIQDSQLLMQPPNPTSSLPHPENINNDKSHTPSVPWDRELESPAQISAQIRRASTLASKIKQNRSDEMMSPYSHVSASAQAQLFFAEHNGNSSIEGARTSASYMSPIVFGGIAPVHRVEAAPAGLQAKTGQDDTSWKFMSGSVYKEAGAVDQMQKKGRNDDMREHRLWNDFAHEHERL